MANRWILWWGGGKGFYTGGAVSILLTLNQKGQKKAKKTNHEMQKECMAVSKNNSLRGKLHIVDIKIDYV